VEYVSLYNIIKYFTQEPINQNTYHESMPSNNQMRQVKQLLNGHNLNKIPFPDLWWVIRYYGGKLILSALYIFVVGDGS
jgi:hypothetical protein